jgi:general secretion pathway protein A
MPSSDETQYESFFGLREQPFALTTDPRFLFLSASHRRAYDELLTGLRRREGLLVLTGETGTGKTTLCRAVIDALGHRTFAALILDPYMSDAEVLRVILRDFGLVSRDEIRRGALKEADLPQLLDTLEGFLRTLIPLESYAVVIIDEAQSLSARVLDQIRVLGSMERDGHRLLQIVLVGQPGLTATLKSEPLRALNERISRRVSLSPLQAAEVDGYIRHRLNIAGGKDAVSFAGETTHLIMDLSRGLPRRVNLLCDRALEEARAAKSRTITPAIITRAAKSLAGSAAEDGMRPDIDPDSRLILAVPDDDVEISLGIPEPRRGKGRLIALIVLLLVVIAGAVGYIAWGIAEADPDRPFPQPAPAYRGAIPPPPPATLPTDDEIAALLLTWK